MQLNEVHTININYTSLYIYDLFHRSFMFDILFMKNKQKVFFLFVNAHCTGALLNVRC